MKQIPQNELKNTYGKPLIFQIFVKIIKNEIFPFMKLFLSLNLWGGV